MLIFEWDSEKARENEQKHQVTFTEAAEVFENDEAVGTPICSWTPAQILNDDFWPEEATPSGPRGEQ